jgi:hypothetical protein
MRGWMIRTLTLLFVLFAAAAVSPAQAAHLVTFTRGQSIVAQKVEKRGAWYYFTLDGGGEMGVLASQVTRIEDYEAPPPSAIPAANSESIQPPTPGSGQPPTPSSGPQSSLGVNPGGSELRSGESLPATDVRGGAPVPSDDSSDDDQAQGNDWRVRNRMNGGPSIQQGGGVRKPGMMGSAGGAGRIQGFNPNNNPYRRRTPPPQTGNPTP